MPRKILLLQLIFLLAVQIATAQDTKKKTPNVKLYWLVVLKTGPQDKVITDSIERSTIFKGHFANMERLYNDGVLKAAGPFGKNEFTWRGLFILDCATKEEAEAHVKTDPSVAVGIFIFDIAPWYSEPTGSFKPGKPDKSDGQ
jgi:uncharacterized protein YciI